MLSKLSKTAKRAYELRRRIIEQGERQRTAIESICEIPTGAKKYNNAKQAVEDSEASI